MTKYYIQKPWPDFQIGETVYDLSHLNEFILEAEDSARTLRKILVSPSDHCFTRIRDDADTEDMLYPNCSRGYQGVFCPTRYENSKGLPERVGHAILGKVWRVDGENFAIIPNASQSGFYGIFFSLDKLKGFEIDLHMRIRSAYPMHESPITYGNVRFAHLMALRLQNKMPPRILTHHRKKPG